MEIKHRGGTLIIIEKGQSGNPKGRTPGSKNRRTILKNWLETPIKLENPETKEIVSCTLEDRVVLALIKKALSGDVPAIKEIHDVLYRKIKETIEFQKEQPLFPDVHTDDGNK
jgi:hypothetical protein